MILALSFARPTWLLALLAVPLLAALAVLAVRRRRRYAVRFTALPTLAAVLPGNGGWRRYVAPALFLLAVAGLALALGRPERTVAIPVEKASVMLITDTSNSMIADDVQPSRLEAARSAAKTFLDKVPAGLDVGAVAYSTGPYQVIQPTTNHGEIRSLLDSLSPDGATATGDAIIAALDALKDQRGKNGKRAPAAIILLSDGQTTAGRDPVGAAREARRQRIPIYTVALGTPDGTIPGPGGSSIPVPPDPQTLAQIAKVTGGHAFTVGGAGELDAVYQRLGSQIGSRHVQREVTSAFAAGAALLLAAALLAGVRWGGRLP